MVRNTKGGNKHKKFARKNMKDKGEFTGKLRKSEHPDEIYASVSKLFGNGRVEILCSDGETRHCVIRNKFRGKGKRDNELSIGTIILAGKRAWVTKNIEKKEVCDLLYVYGGSELNKLKMQPELNISLLQSTSQPGGSTEVEFFDSGMPEEDTESEEDNEETENEPTPQESGLTTFAPQEIVNVDDI